jgi:hypothetical protein
MRLLVTAYRGVSLISKAIRWQTWSDYSHVGLGLWFDDRMTLADWIATGETIEAWQSGGVRSGKAGPCAGHTLGTRIDLFDLPGAWPATQATAWHFASQQVGKGYDFRGVLRFLPRSGRHPDSDDRWFCSELVEAALYEAYSPLLLRIEPQRVTPALIVLSPLLRYIGSCQHPKGWGAPMLFADPGMDPLGHGRDNVCGKVSFGPMPGGAAPSTPAGLGGVAAW